MTDTKICEWCKEDFSPKRKDSRFCSNTHYTDCETCGTSIPIKLMKRVPRYCSISCSSKSNSYECVCELCGKGFVSGKAGSKFCKDTHYSSCVVCGSQFVLLPHQPAKTCSKRCAALIIDFDERGRKSVESTKAKYGVENVSQAQSVKDKKRETTLKNYGVENPSLSPEVQAKREATFMEKYGFESAWSAPEVREKIRQTNLERYGVEFAAQANSVRSKIKDTMLERYGVENIFLLPENIQKAAKNSGRRVSLLNKAWQERLLSELGINFSFEELIGVDSDGKSHFADLGYGDLLIDFNPAVTHNSSFAYPHFTGLCTVSNCMKHFPKASNWHQDRALLAEREGKLLLQFFDWFDEDIFVSVVRSKLKLDENRVPAKKCELREVSQPVANRFFRENHLLGASNKQSLCVGLFVDDELVHCHSYGRARMNRNVEWEAIRSCSKMNWQVQGGYSRCDAYFFRKVDPVSVISYVDLNTSVGGTEASQDGWRAVRTNKPDGTWVSLSKPSLVSGRPLFVRDSVARRVSADRVLGFEVGEKYPRFFEDGSKVSNDFVLLSEGYVEVFDAGKRTFVWKK